MVVDLQPRFLVCPSEPVTEIVRMFCANVAHLVREAVARGEQIILVGWRDEGSIEPCILSAARGAPRVVRLTKSRMDLLDPKGDEYHANLTALQPLRGSSATVRVTGVSARACVLSTAQGIAREGMVCQVPAHGIIEHPTVADMRLYRSYNDPLHIITEFGQIPSARPVLDTSRLELQNLVDVHERIYRERMIPVAAE